MNKKHFIALADCICSSRAAFSVSAILCLAAFCLSQNPDFNRDQWLAYITGECGPNGGKIR